MSLYKYLTFERMDILENAHIRFTQPSAFNDPFETFPSFQAFAPIEEIEKYANDHKWDENETNKILEEAWQNEMKKYPGVNISFSLVKNQMGSVFEKSKPMIMEMFKKFMGMKGEFFKDMATNTVMKALNSTIGILCLTEAPDNILMWSHYAKNHTGFIIEFDNSHDFFDQRKKDHELRGHVKKVRYSKHRPKVTIYDPNLSKEENINIWINDFFWVKSVDWKYEKEWRIIYTLKECQKVISYVEPPVCLFPLPLESIKSVIIGSRASKPNKEAMCQLLSSRKDLSHISLKAAILDKDEYKINIHNDSI